MHNLDDAADFIPLNKDKTALNRAAHNNRSKRKRSSGNGNVFPPPRQKDKNEAYDGEDEDCHVNVVNVVNANLPWMKESKDKDEEKTYAEGIIG